MSEGMHGPQKQPNCLPDRHGLLDAGLQVVSKMCSALNIQI